MSATTPTIPEGPLVGSSRFGFAFESIRLVISFLKWRFSLLPQGSYRYDLEDDGPEQKNSEIYIGAECPLRAETVGKRPAITVLRSQLVGSGLGLGDMAYVDWPTGAKVRQDLYPTNIMINCLSSEPVEAEGLADFVMSQISAMRDDIVKESRGLMMAFGMRPAMSPPSPAGSLVESTEVEWTVVVLSYPCYLQRQDTMLPLNKRVVRGFDITATTTPPAQATEPAVQLQGTAVLQPPQTGTDRAVATGTDPDLLKQAPDEASYSQPLTVQIKTR